MPDGKIADEEFPEFDEDDFTPFINAMTLEEPRRDPVRVLLVVPVPFMQQWKASGNDADIPVVSGSVQPRRAGRRHGAPTRSRRTSTATTAATRICWPRTPVAKEYIDLWAENYGAEFPFIDSFAFQVLSSWTMLKGSSSSRAPRARGLEGAHRVGDVRLDGPYNAGPTYVNPINHMSDTCAVVGQIVFDADQSAPPPTTPRRWSVGCMHDVLPIEEAQELTDNPAVTAEAIAAYQEATGTP